MCLELPTKNEITTHNANCQALIIPIAIVLLAGFTYYVYRHIKRAQRPVVSEQTPD